MSDTMLCSYNLSDKEDCPGSEEFIKCPLYWTLQQREIRDKENAMTLTEDLRNSIAPFTSVTLNPEFEWIWGRQWTSGTVVELEDCAMCGERRAAVLWDGPNGTETVVVHCTSLVVKG